MRKKEVATLAALAGAAAIVLLWRIFIWAVVGYVVVHFLLKFW